MEKQSFIPHKLKDFLMKEEEIMQNKKTANTAEDVVKKKTAAQVQGKEKDSNGSTASGKSIKNLSSIPDFDMILGQGVHYSRDDYRTKLNNNVCVVGTSGAGKTRSIVKPNLMQASGSYVVSDPKGNLARELGPYLEKKGYDVVRMDFIHPEKSVGYNPLDYCRTTQEIQQLAHLLVYEMNMQENNASRPIDPFWDEATLILLMSLLAYIKESDDISEEEKNLSMLSKLIRESKCKNEKGKSVSYSINDCARNTSLDYRMEEHRHKAAKQGTTSWAVERYDDYNVAPNRTFYTINITSLAKLATFDTPEIRKMIARTGFDFRKVGQKPMAVFVEVSDTDRSLDILVNLFYSQLMNELCRFADEECKDSRLPIPVQFILDDFATNARIGNFQNMIANIRSRGISAMIMLQSEAQLKAYYGDNAQTIIDNCNTYVYMGGSNPEQAKLVGKRANKIDTTILNMPIGKCWVFRRGQEPILCDNFDLEAFRREKGLVKEELDESDLDIEGRFA